MHSPRPSLSEFLMSVFLRFASILALALVPALLPAADPEPEIQIERSVVYGTAGGEKLYLDIAIPPGKGPFPCVVMLHGGAWQGGSRHEFSLGDRDKIGRAYA